MGRRNSHAAAHRRGCWGLLFLNHYFAADYSWVSIPFFKATGYRSTDTTVGPDSLLVLHRYRVDGDPNAVNLTDG
jgi:hypothetical protein